MSTAPILSISVPEEYAEEFRVKVKAFINRLRGIQDSAVQSQSALFYKMVLFGTVENRVDGDYLVLKLQEQEKES